MSIVDSRSDMPRISCTVQTKVVIVRGEKQFRSMAMVWRLGLLHDQVTVSVTRPDWPVWS